MKKLLLFSFAFVILFPGCGAYNSRQVSKDVPKNKSYCQRLDDMAVGIEPYMMKEKTALVFDNDLQKEGILALDVAMIADGDTSYVVKKADINAIDEFGNEFKPITPQEVAARIDRAMRKDDGLLADIQGRDMPEEVEVSRELAQHFLFYDMTSNHAEAREFTVYIAAASTDGTKQKAFRLTVDPMRTFMNPTERWSSYDDRGVTPCGWEEEAPVAMAEPVVKTDEAEKMERIFEKSLEK